REGPRARPQSGFPELCRSGRRPGLIFVPTLAGAATDGRRPSAFRQRLRRTQMLLQGRQGLLRKLLELGVVALAGVVLEKLDALLVASDLHGAELVFEPRP